MVLRWLPSSHSEAATSHHPLLREMACPNRHERRGVRKFGERNQAIQEDINNSVSKMRGLVTLKLGLSIDGIPKESFSDEEE